MISYWFNLIFYKPLFNGLVFLYNIIPGHDLGFAIIILTALIRFILWPLTNKGIKNQKILAKIQPQIEEVRKKLKDNKEEQAKALMKIYADNKINPLAGFLPLLIQIPIIIALWQVFLRIVDFNVVDLYSFISAPTYIQMAFLGFIDLSKRNVALAILAGALQYFQTKMIMPPATASAKNDFGSIMAKQMLYMGPVISIVIFWSLPAALPLYWIVVTLLTLLQQYIHQNDRGSIKPN